MNETGGEGGISRGFDDDLNPPTRTVMPAHALAVGSRIRDYQIISLLGEGGFGIVYLAMDVLLERQVAVKEYLPTSIAWRNAGSLQVAVRSARDQDTFALGLRSFVNEARLLARFDHPSLVKVHRFWEENGTAYMVMPFYKGRTLQRTLEKLGRRPTEAELRAWLAPLMDALQVLHAAQCYHRDISPDNILITDSGPMLLDFGAARRVIGDVQRALTVVLKPGFAPIEQYGDTPGMHQGAWTDVYALAGVLFAAITGRRPLPAVSRLMEDKMPLVSEVAAGQYSANFLRAIDRGLALRPHDRPQSVAEFRALLDGLAFEATPATSRPSAPPAFAVSTQPVDLDLSWGDPPAAVPSAATPGPLRHGSAAPASVLPTPTPRPGRTPAAPRRQAAPLVARQRIALIVAGAALLLLAALGWMLYRNDKVDMDAELPAARSPRPEPESAPASGPNLNLAPPLVVPSEQAPRAAEPQASAPPLVAPTTAPTAAAEETLAPPAAASQAISPASPAPVESKPRTPKPTKMAKEAKVQPMPAAASPADQARCSDILKKGSLEPLTAEETAFLRRQCR